MIEIYFLITTSPEFCELNSFCGEMDTQGMDTDAYVG